MTQLIRRITSRIVEIKEILNGLREGKIGVEEALDRLKGFPYQDLGFAKLDTHRGLRKGHPETVFCEGKSIEQLKEIAKKMVESRTPMLGLRAKQDVYMALKEEIKEKISYNEDARTIVIGKEPSLRGKGRILVITAGTADIPVAEEAFVTAEFMGNRTDKLYDVGIAGIHRLLDNREHLLSANVLIVVAGMEGALPSVIGGLVSKPVIAVPTSIGYGASLGGLAALFTMLNSCAPGIATVNIDNGFGAGYLAGIINQMNTRIQT